MLCVRAWRRCQDSTSRLAVKFKVREGRAAALSAFVIPAITPKVCVSVKHGIRPLCLHTRVAEADTSRPMNDLTFTGAPALPPAHTQPLSSLHGPVGSLHHVQDRHSALRVPDCVRRLAHQAEWYGEMQSGQQGSQPDQAWKAGFS